MMRLNFSLGSIALVLSFLLGSCLGLRPAVDEFYRRHVVAAEREAKVQAQKRQVCVNDTILQDFEADSYDTYPFCSSFLGIQGRTTTVTVSTRTSESLNLRNILSFFSDILQHHRYSHYCHSGHCCRHDSNNPISDDLIH